KNIIPIYKKKGTLDSYQIIFKALGFDTVILTNENITFTFDSPLTFDSPIRRFDTNECNKCAYYTLELSGNLVVGDTMLDSINKALKIVEPIYAQLYDITLNGSSINIIVIFVDSNGDLVYNVANLSNLSVNAQGDLVSSGDDEFNYSIANNGDLLYEEPVSFVDFVLNPNGDLISLGDQADRFSL